MTYCTGGTKRMGNVNLPQPTSFASSVISCPSNLMAILAPQQVALQSLQHLETEMETRD